MKRQLFGYHQHTVDQWRSEQEAKQQQLTEELQHQQAIHEELASAWNAICEEEHDISNILMDASKEVMESERQVREQMQAKLKAVEQQCYEELQQLEAQQRQLEAHLHFLYQQEADWLTKVQALVEQQLTQLREESLTRIETKSQASMPEERLNKQTIIDFPRTKEEVSTQVPTYTFGGDCS